MERVMGIEPSPHNSEFAQNQPLPTHAPEDYTQGRAQIVGTNEAGRLAPENRDVVPTVGFDNPPRMLR